MVRRRTREWLSYKLSSPSGLKWGVDLINRLSLIKVMVSMGPGSGIRYGIFQLSVVYSG